VGSDILEVNRVLLIEDRVHNATDSLDRVNLERLALGLLTENSRTRSCMNHVNLLFRKNVLVQSRPDVNVDFLFLPFSFAQNPRWCNVKSPLFSDRLSLNGSISSLHVQM